MAESILTLTLPEEALDFAERYAAQHGVTVQKMVDAYLRRLREHADSPIHPAVQRISGLLPSEMDAVAEAHEHRLQKHR